MKNIFINTITLAGVLFAMTAGAETIITNEFWICDSTNTGNLGTLDNPYDGSTQTKFDTIMVHIPPGSTVHILAGTYETWGYYDWNAQSGEKIIGSGIDNTILQFPSGTPEGSTGNIVIGSVDSATNIEVSDLTCDCNWQGNGDTFGGVGLDGTRNAVRRVKVIHCGYTPGTNSEAFAIVLSNDHLPSSEGNIIEECEVSEFSGGDKITAISFNGAQSNWISGIIRNNHVFLSPDPIGAQIAYNGSSVYDSLIEGNYADGADVGAYGDTFGTTNTIYAHNIFKNVYQGFVFWNYTRGNLTFDFNKIFLTPSGSFFSTAFGFPDGTCHTNIVILGNDVEFDGAPTRTAYFLYVTNVTGIMIGDNTVDSSLDNYLSATGSNMFNNYDLNGNYLPGLNIPTVGGTEVSSFGLSLISSAGASSALTNLGLPSNPMIVVTNDQSGLTLGGTFSGNGSGLTGLNWSDITGVPTFAQYSDPAPTFTNGMNIGAKTAYQIGGYNVLWVSNDPGVGEDLVVGLEPSSVIVNGIGNMVAGSYAMLSSTNANYSTMVGINAGRVLLSSQNNTFVGANAGYLLQYGNDNTLVGFQAGFGGGNLTNGYENTLIGDCSLYRAKSGTNNVALGYFAGSWLSSGNNNVFIAHQGTSAETNSNGTIYIGDPGVHNATYVAGNVYAGGGIIGTSLIATNGFQCSTNYTPSLWTPVSGSVIFRTSNNWMYAITQFSTNAAFKIGP